MKDESASWVDAGLTREAAGDVRMVVRGGAVQIAGQVIQRSLRFLFGAVAARILLPAGFGRYRKVVQILAIAAQIGLAGFNYAAMRSIARARARGDHGGVLGAVRVGMSGAVTSSLVVFAVLLLGAEAIAEQFYTDPGKQGDFAALLRLGAAYAPLFALMQVLRYCTQAYKTMVPSVMAGNIVQPAVHFAIGVTVLVVTASVAGAVTSLVVSVGLGAGLAGFYFLRLLTPEERGATPRARIGEMVRFALPQGGSSLLGIQNLGLGVIVIGLVVESDRAVGLFAIALALQGPGTTFLGGIVNIWAPVVSDLYERGELARLASLYQTITRWVATFSFPVSAALILEPDLFGRLYGGGRAEAAAPVIAILAAGNFFYTGTGPTGYVISMTGRPGVNFANSVVAVAAYGGFGAWAVARYGVVGMAVVDALVTALVNSARVVEAKILVGVQPFGRAFLKPVVATLVGAGVLLAWRLVPGDGSLLEVAGIVVAAMVYVAVLRLLGLNAEERYVLDRMKARVAGSLRRGRA